MFRSTLTAASLALVAAFSLPAQNVKLQATIPFDFHIGAAVLPAGEYLVTHSSGFLMLRGQYSRPQSAAVVVFNTTKGIETAVNSLVFNRYGEDYYLSTVWQEGAGAGLVLPKAKQEQVRSRVLTDTASSLRAPQAAIVNAVRVK